MEGAIVEGEEEWDADLQDERRSSQIFLHCGSVRIRDPPGAGDGEDATPLALRSSLRTGGGSRGDDRITVVHLGPRSLEGDGRNAQRTVVYDRVVYEDTFLGRTHHNQSVAHVCFPVWQEVGADEDNDRDMSLKPLCQVQWSAMPIVNAPPPLRQALNCRSSYTPSLIPKSATTSSSDTDSPQYASTMRAQAARHKPSDDCV